MKVKALNSQIYTEASEWLIEFRSGDIDSKGREEFYRWLRTSPEHMRAYLELAAIWNEGGALDAEHSFDDARLGKDLLTEGNVIPLETNFRSPQPELSTGMGRKRWNVLAVAASVILAFAGFGLWNAFGRETYVTAIGEERSITLADGSRIDLDSKSRVRVTFSDGVRSVELLQGQALFHVARDHTRPFIVRTDNAQVRAVGTEFDVYRNRAATTVTVVEGTVAVLPVVGSATERAEPDEASSRPALSPTQSPAVSPLTLSAGDQVIVTPAMQPSAVKADVAAATAWTQHELIFKGTPLEDVVAEFNRYNKRRLVIRDASIANLKVTGIFSSTEPSSLIRFLKARPDIIVNEGGQEFLIFQKL
jgi:transmembrane sensor